jgi:hypothetical protein
MKPSPECINEKKEKFVVIREEVDVASEEYDRFSGPLSCNFARAIRA